MREPPSPSDPPAVLVDCIVVRSQRIDVGSTSSLVRVTVQAHDDADPRTLAGAKLLVADGAGHRLHDALPAPIPARAGRLTLGFAVSRSATALSLELGGRSLPLAGAHALDAERVATDRLQLEALRCVSRQLRTAQGLLAEARVCAALMRIERDNARRAAVRAEAAAYDATTRADTVVHAPAPAARRSRRASHRTAVAVCALSSTALALAVLGWPTRDGASDRGVGAVAAASPLAKSTATSAWTAGPAAAILARRLQIPVDYLELYRSTGTRYGLDWTRLAAVGAIESTHGQARAPGVASGANARGASGPAQFLVGTWERFGVDGDANGIRDPHAAADAIPAMASYLRASGAPQDWRGALRSYNHSDVYVEAVERLAARYRRGARPQGAARPGARASTSSRPSSAWSRGR